ncbi:MAG: ASPIC/UnbV domain-containing protein [Pirellulaceae bacterium]|nr:ASPIC/UnbV domain-containing protein [Pirellulaceae bacterium]
MSQPCEKQANVEQPSELDEDLNEFWVGNPWDIFRQHNLSSFERNRAYVNVEGKGFLEISHLTNADVDSDSRAVLAIDIFEPGKLDLVVRQVGGGPLKFFRNRFPKSNYLKVSLNGIQSNRMGIGSRLIAHLGDRKIVRELFPTNSYQSQQPAWVHFGLGKQDKIDKLEIQWPNGLRQELKDLSVNRHILVVEGKDTVQDFALSVPISQ